MLLKLSYEFFIRKFTSHNIHETENFYKYNSVFIEHKFPVIYHEIKSLFKFYFHYFQNKTVMHILLSPFLQSRKSVRVDEQFHVFLMITESCNNHQILTLGHFHSLQKEIHYSLVVISHLCTLQTRRPRLNTSLFFAFSIHL